MAISNRRLRHRFGDHLMALARWWMFIVLLSSKTAGERFGRSDWRTTLAILEPMALIFIFGFVQEYVLHSAPPFGTSSILFCATGLLPYYLFFHTSQKIRGLDFTRNIPGATWSDYALSYLIGEIVLKILIMVMLFSYLWMIGVRDAIPDDLMGCIPPLVVVTLIGFAVGVFNAVVMSIFEIWYYVYIVLVRGLMVFSAVFFVLDYMPPQFREMAAYNPLAQAMTWFRSSFYSHYPAMTLDLPYLLEVTVCMLALAMLLEASTRSWRETR